MPCRRSWVRVPSSASRKPRKSAAFVVRGANARVAWLQNGCTRCRGACLTPAPGASRRRRPRTPRPTKPSSARFVRSNPAHGAGVMGWLPCELSGRDLTPCRQPHAADLPWAGGTSELPRTASARRAPPVSWDVVQTSTHPRRSRNLRRPARSRRPGRRCRHIARRATPRDLPRTRGGRTRAAPVPPGSGRNGTHARESRAEQRPPARDPALAGRRLGVPCAQQDLRQPARTIVSLRERYCPFCGTEYRDEYIRTE